MNLDSIQNIYIIGIEGAGTSALACILKSQGKNVMGSDEGDHFYYDVLKKKDIKVFHKFRKDNLKQAPSEGEKIDLIIYSTSVTTEQNEELKHAIESDIDHYKLLSYPQALAMVFNASKFGIAVCGTHGKTTTTAMLATAMKKIGANPTALVGSKVPGWDGGALVGNSDYFIIEADEYQNKLEYYNPQAVILTSVDYDHPDFFKTVDEYKQVFKDFVARIPEDGFLVAYAGDKNVLEISKSAECEVIFYDELSVKSGVLEEEFCPDSGCHGKKVGCCAIAKKENKLIGMHNLLNATAALRVIQKLELDEKKAIDALREFQGTARRFEIKGENNGAIIIDDYAHHPTEVRAVLQATKEKYPTKNIKCIFHPHTFTRTEALLNDFAKSFNDADEIYLLDIFGSAREKQGGITSDDLAVAIKKQIKQNESAGEVVPLEGAFSDRRGGTSKSVNIKNKGITNTKPKVTADNTRIIKNLHTIPEATKYFQQNLQPNDILITIGAGDVYLVGENLLKKKG